MPPTIRNTEGPLNDLFYALNFYISTGDHIGEGYGTPKADLDTHFAGLREKILSGEGV